MTIVGCSLTPPPNAAFLKGDAASDGGHDTNDKNHTLTRKIQSSQWFDESTTGSAGSGCDCTGTNRFSLTKAPAVYDGPKEWARGGIIAISWL